MKPFDDPPTRLPGWVVTSSLCSIFVYWANMCDILVSIDNPLRFSSKTRRHPNTNAVGLSRSALGGQSRWHRGLEQSVEYHERLPPLPSRRGAVHVPRTIDSAWFPFLRDRSDWVRSRLRLKGLLS